MGATLPFYEIAQEASEGVYSVCVYTSDNQNAEVRKFNQAYKDYYGIPPQDFFAALGYDAVKTIQRAKHDAGSTTDREKIRDAYRNIKDSRGASGLTYYGSPDGEVIHELLMITYENGKHKVIAAVKGD
jgi:ABC-type branched-subunit amino acid transport system substrate-binding protein